MSIDWNNLFLTWYTWLSGLNATLAQPIFGLSDGLGIPLVSAFLFGLLGTTAPCQLSTNFGAITFLTRHPSDKGATVRATLAYISAKVLVYTLIGIIVLTTGQQVMAAVGPYLDLPRKFVGPTMIVLGLAVLGVIRFRFQFGQKVARRIEKKAAAGLGAGERIPLNQRPTQSSREQMARRPDQRPVQRPVRREAQPALAPFRAMAPAAVLPSGSAEPATVVATRVPDDAPASNAPSVWSSFLLGAGFSLAFCPTLLLLFFGVTMSLAASSSGGFTFPALFALGTALPLILFVGLALTSAKAAERFRRGMRKANRPLRWIGGIFLILLGLHDTLIYWFL